MLVRLATFLLALLTLPAAAQTCGSRLFVSGFFSTVHVFDACTGQYLRDLDTPARLAGPMAVRLGPDGLLYVVAETAGVIRKYRNDTLEPAGDFAQVPAIGATGLAFDAAGIAYVAGYNSDDVKRFDRSGAALGAAFPARFSGLDGPDNGMIFGSDANLYIPGYDSSSVVRWDPRTGQTSVAVATRAAGLLATRGLLAARDGAHMFVTSERSGAVLRWNLASGAVAVFATGFSQPTGIDYAPDGTILVSHDGGVVKLDAASGARIGTFVAPGAGGVSGQVFLAVIPVAASSVDPAQVGSQFWRMELVSCTQARFSWDSTGAGSAGFGAGTYDVFRYFENEATARCRAQGIDAADKSWVNGQWWGGQARSGEGLFVDRGADGRTFFAWFTTAPAPASPQTPPRSARSTGWSETRASTAAGWRSQTCSRPPARPSGPASTSRSSRSSAGARRASIWSRARRPR